MRQCVRVKESYPLSDFIKLYNSKRKWIMRVLLNQGKHMLFVTVTLNLQERICLRDNFKLTFFDRISLYLFVYSFSSEQFYGKKVRLQDNKSLRLHFL